MTFNHIEEFDINKLGSFYFKNKTIFRVYSLSSNNLKLILEDQEFLMNKNNHNFEICIDGDLEKQHYYFVNEKGDTFFDPFAYLSDDKGSIILDPNKFNKKRQKCEKQLKTCIYELNVRDFSCDELFESIYQRKILAFTDDNLKIVNQYEYGLAYLKQLGISHIQLLPINNFDNDYSDYNWGYNPIAYNYLKKDYIYNIQDPYAHINEFIEVVNVLHKNNLKVNLDVVFNHVYNYHINDLTKMMGLSIYRFLQDGRIANGNYCGNEIASENVFMRAYILKMCQRYVELFDIDGLRFDLMGILDIDTINLVKEELRKIKKDILIYGEGWNMGEVLKIEDRATILNASKLKDVYFFNDYYRDTLVHFVSGNKLIYEDLFKIMSAKNSYLNYQNSVNYVECHDNYTFYDRMLKYLENENEDLHYLRSKLALAIIFFSQGIPFIQAGQEFLRTKNLVENSFNSKEEINKIDWLRRIKYDSLCQYVKELLAFRNENDYFNLSDLDFSYYIENEVFILRINDLYIYINNDAEKRIINLDKKAHLLFGENGRCDYFDTNFILNGPSLVALTFF